METKLEQYKQLLEQMTEESNLNSELISYDLQEIQTLEELKKTTQRSMEFFIEVSFELGSATPETLTALKSLIEKMVQNGFEITYSNEAINIALEKCKLIAALQQDIDFIKDDLLQFVMEQQDLANFQAATRDQIKTLTKKI